MERMLINAKYKHLLCWLTLGLLLMTFSSHVYGVECTGNTYREAEFDKEETHFSPYDTIYLIVDCTDLEPGMHTMHANWVHAQRGLVRSDKYQFENSEREKRGIYFWFKLSKKGPIASMLSNQDFYEKNFGDWTVDTYVDDELVLTRQFTLSDEIR